ncbi:MAG: ABC transporter ATP-binding protein [Caldilineae bacterium]|nr:MAG: ABC transporter ATP-binding protein [Caldilineae bacterium]
MSREYVIETKGLTKRYNSVTAVDHLDLRVQRGEVYGLLGPNGSGKTTTILMLLGLTEPTSGQVRVLGMDPARSPLKVKARTGYMPDEVGFYDELTARENLIYIAKLNGIPRDEAYRRIDEAPERMGLADVRDRPVATFSRGMRQRLGVADVLIKQPQLIIMDEPTQGLDPEAAREFLEIIRGLKQEGITILLSSHLLHQVQAVCDRVGLFSRGRKVLEGTVSELARQVLGSAYRIHIQVEGDAPDLPQALQHIPDVTHVQHNGDGHYAIEAARDRRAAVANTVVAAGANLIALNMETLSLDDIYAQYFKEVEHGSKN